MSDLKIFLLCEAAGGVARHVIDLYAGLRQREVPAKLMMSPLRLEEMFREELREVPETDRVMIPIHRGLHASDVRVLQQLRREFAKEQGPFIVHAHSTKAAILIAALRRQLPITFYTPHAYRGSDPDLRPAQRALIRLAEASFSRRFDRIIAVSPAERKYAGSLRVKEHRIRYIPNGVRQDHYRPSGRRLLGVDLPLNLGFVGRLAPQKNPMLFLDVLHEVSQRVPDVRATIVGTGPYEAAMRQRAETLGVTHRIAWRGAVCAREVLPSFDILVHTSTYEGLPYTLIESAAVTVPIVSTANEGARAILEGALPDALVPGFAAPMAQKVVELVSNPRLLEHHHRQLQAIAQQFSCDRMIDALVEEYRSAAECGPAAYMRQRTWAPGIPG